MYHLEARNPGCDQILVCERWPSDCDGYALAWLEAMRERGLVTRVWKDSDTHKPIMPKGW